MIAIPSMIMLMAIFYYLWKTIHGLTGLSLEEIMANSGQEMCIRDRADPVRYRHLSVANRFHRPEQQ